MHSVDTSHQPYVVRSRLMCKRERENVTAMSGVTKRDTAHEGQGAKHHGSGYPDNDSKCPEEELELLLGQPGTNVVHKGIDLTQPKHTERLWEVVTVRWWNQGEW